MNSKDETAAGSARMPQNKKTPAFVADSTVYSDNLRKSLFSCLNGGTGKWHRSSTW